MQTVPILLKDSFSPDLVNKFSLLNNTYLGLRLKDESKEYSILEEIEHYIAVSILSASKYQSEALKSQFLQRDLYEILELSTFAKLDVRIGDFFWNPNVETFNQFSMTNFENGTLSISSNEHSQFCLKQYFKSLKG